MKDIEYQLEYNNYYARKELTGRLNYISSRPRAINESYLTEADRINIKDAIIKYSEKFVKSIQQAWDKFKQFMGERTWDQVKEKYGKLLTENRPLTITDVNENDVIPIPGELTKFLDEPNGNITIDTLNEKYENPTDLLHKSYKYFDTVDEFSKGKMQEFIRSKCFRTPKVGEQITADQIKDLSTFLDEAPKKMEIIGKDLDNINNAIKVIKTAAASMTVETPNNNGESVEKGNIEHNSAVYDLACQYLSPLLELKTQDSQDPNGEHTNNSEGANQNKLIQKHIMDFYKIYSTVLTLKMNNLNKAKSSALKICLAYGRNAAKYNNETNVEQPTSIETTANTKDTVSK